MERLVKKYQANIKKGIAVKSFLLTILPVIFGRILTVAIAEEIFIKKILLGTLFVIVLAVDIFSLYFFGVVEHRIKRSEKDNRLMEKMLELMNSTIVDSSNSVYNSIVKARDSDHTEPKNWDLIKTNGDKVCQVLYEYICSTAAEGHDFSVNIIFKQEKDGEPGYRMECRVATRGHAVPTIYQTFKSQRDAQGSCYSNLLENQDLEPKICFNKKEVSAEFQKYDDLTSQYIGIPIYCAGGNKFALLQVVAYNNSKIRSTRPEMKDVIDNFFVPVANLVLLVNKAENVIQMINSFNDRRNADFEELPPTDKKTTNGLRKMREKVLRK